MAPPRMGGSSAATKKQLNQTVDVEDEEVFRTSTLMPPTIFHRYYLPLRKDDAPLVNILMNSKFPFPILPVPKGISSDEDMLDKVANLKFMDHDITET